MKMYYFLPMGRNKVCIPMNGEWACAFPRLHGYGKKKKMLHMLIYFAAQKSNKTNIFWFSLFLSLIWVFFILKMQATTKKMTKLWSILFLWIDWCVLLLEMNMSLVEVEKRMNLKIFSWKQIRFSFFDFLAVDR